MYIKFHDENHEIKYQLLRADVKNAEALENKGCLAVLYLMAGDSRLDKLFRSYFQIESCQFAYKRMLNDYELDSDLLRLAKLAAHLFDGRVEMTPMLLDEIHEDRDWFLAWNAVMMRRFGTVTGYEVPSNKFYQSYITEDFSV
ncbi:hypothetical protein [Terribacillus sp. DMT04]|uniref:hypothetical protein n=1 Tax=Terribacillus sp. DMT04 TaxID=2850441 RepID=UPI001C2B79A5|nr:hypothetical protein [Terribacillus sp. DMT04]QXE01412.1 hypothetical protein KS242_15730 [Terribacillus sp. DMT04]